MINWLTLKAFFNSMKRVHWTKNRNKSYSSRICGTTCGDNLKSMKFFRKQQNGSTLKSNDFTVLRYLFINQNLKMTEFGYCSLKRVLMGAVMGVGPQ